MCLEDFDLYFNSEKKCCPLGGNTILEEKRFNISKNHIFCRKLIYTLDYCLILFNIVIGKEIVCKFSLF